MKTIFINPKDVERKWYLIDAENQVLGRIAEKVASIVRGKYKACYTPHQEVGDYVIIINADKLKVTGNKVRNKLYYRHSGYPGGIKVENYAKVISRKPIKPLEKAIKGMLPKGPLGNKLFRNVKIYAGVDHPHAAQKPEVLELT
jgi:large subunit ribosomal protein L13